MARTVEAMLGSARQRGLRGGEGRLPAAVGADRDRRGRSPGAGRPRPRRLGAAAGAGGVGCGRGPRAVPRLRRRLRADAGPGAADHAAGEAGGHAAAPGCWRHHQRAERGPQAPVALQGRAAGPGRVAGHGPHAGPVRRDRRSARRHRLRPHRARPDQLCRRAGRAGAPRRRRSNAGARSWSGCAPVPEARSTRRPSRATASSSASATWSSATTRSSSRRRPPRPSGRATGPTCSRGRCRARRATWRATSSPGRARCRGRRRSSPAARRR